MSRKEVVGWFDYFEEDTYIRVYNILEEKMILEGSMCKSFVKCLILKFKAINGMNSCDLISFEKRKRTGIFT